MKLETTLMSLHLMAMIFNVIIFGKELDLSNSPECIMDVFSNIGFDTYQ